MTGIVDDAVERSRIATLRSLIFSALRTKDAEERVVYIERLPREEQTIAKGIHQMLVVGLREEMVDVAHQLIELIGDPDGTAQYIALLGSRRQELAWEILGSPTDSDASDHLGRAFAEATQGERATF